MKRNFLEIQREINKITEEKRTFNERENPDMTLREYHEKFEKLDKRQWELKVERARSLIGKCFKYQEAGYTEFILVEKVEKRNKHEEDSSEIFGMINFGERSYVGAFLNITDHGIYDIPMAIRNGAEISQEEFKNELKKFKEKISLIEQRIEKMTRGEEN